MESVKVHILHCGSISVSRPQAFGGDSFHFPWTAAFLTPNIARIHLPVSVYLIEHKHGLFLIDTGWSRAISPKGIYDPIALSKHTSPVICRELQGKVERGQTAFEQLSEMGIAPSDLDFIFLTNLDADHSSGLQELSQAKRILVAEEEVWWQYRLNCHHCTHIWENIPTEKYYYRGKNIGPTGRAFDLFDDGSVLMVETPGHSKGTTSIKISSNNKFILFCSDNGYTQNAWKTDHVPGMAFNKQIMHKSFEWINYEYNNPNCIAVLNSHDPDTKPGTIEF